MNKRFLYLLTIFILILLLIPFTVAAQENGAFKKENFISSADTLNYRILFPKDFSEEKEYPVFLFLHGAGERGNDNEAQLTHGSQLFLEKQEEFQAIVIFPQAPREDYWAKVEVNRDRMINHYGGNAKLSLYPDDNHNSWELAFTEPYYLPWLFSHERTE